MKRKDAATQANSPSPGSPEEDAVPQVPVVAIGASAGGLEAFTELLRFLPSDTGMAYVFIQHLSPTHESMLSRLLSRDTQMPVHEVEDGVFLSPNQIYVIPPNAAMVIDDGSLSLKRREGAGTQVDVFLRSLAETRGAASVGVILSGTGSDGALGIQAIAEVGGVVFAQLPETAKFDGMPRSAIATDCVDVILPPKEIAAELARLAREPRLLKPDRPEAAGLYPVSAEDIQAVLELVHNRSGIDLGLYRRETVRRRLTRRLALLRISGVRDYLAYIGENPDEVSALIQDVLIRVTRFFRDSSVFDALSTKIFPLLIRRIQPGAALRIWAPGCATGEEAYSLAICFHEAAEQMQSRVPLQLFATDINEAAIDRARRGTYIENISVDVTPERLSRFFVRSGKEYQIARRVRESCVFSRHDLLRDPPFSRMSLLSCRNVLIYLDSMRDSALSRFHFSLNSGGVLLLGKSESAASSPGLFAAMDRGARIYIKQDAPRNPVPLHSGRSTKAPATFPPERFAAVPRQTDVQARTDRLLAERYGPPRVVVNANLEVTRAGSDQSDKRIAEVLRVAQESSGSALNEAVKKAAATGQSVAIEGSTLEGDPLPGGTVVEVTPVGEERAHFLIVFEYPPANAAGDGSPSRSGKAIQGRPQARVRRLERELAASRAQLESFLADQAGFSEEALAANEELQSLNEELESSKEELEATNEELITVNQELQIRNTELENTREFAQATIDTVHNGLLVLGQDLRVLKANKSLFRMFRLSAEEVEHHSIFELADGIFEVSALRKFLEQLLPAKRTIEDYELLYEHPIMGRRTLLLNAHRFDREQRILLAVQDVTEARRYENELHQSQKMEAIGYLAAGVAHDFNNLLTGILGNASLLLAKLGSSTSSSETLGYIISSGEQAAALVRQLLAYAGKGYFYLKQVDLTDTVVRTVRLIQTTLPLTVRLRLELAGDVPTVLADESQIQQLVMNLIINAAEAIGSSGGDVLVRTGRQTLRGETLPDSVLQEKPVPGEYLFLEVTDTGCGMDEATASRIFDPFFTTKFTGRGLGLAAVQGIVRQHKGAIQLHSVLGKGSSFRIFLILGEAAPALDETPEIREDLRGSGLILVIDDEQMIRTFSRAALESYGYEVLLAGDGSEGIRLFREHANKVKIVLLDIGMPGMNGYETLRRLREIQRDTPVLICSGFGELETEQHLKDDEDVAGFLPKPYTAKQLAEAVKERFSVD